MSPDRDLVRGVVRLSGAAALLVAALAWLLGGPTQAAGALAGGGIMIGNFLWLDRVARMVVRRARGEAGAIGAAVWLTTSSLRLGAVALALGLAAVQGWLGLAGLVVALITLPAAVVTEGLRAARLP